MSKIPTRFENKIPSRFKNKIPARFTSEITFPSNAYFLAPDANGNFTKAMVDSAISNGEDYIVFDAETLEIHYEDSPHNIDGWDTYLEINAKGTVAAPITLDFRKCYINCYPNAVDKFKSHRVLTFPNSENLVVKFGKVEGDKFKRALDTDEETLLENTQLYKTGRASKNILIESGDVRGFMGDMASTTVFGGKWISNDPLNPHFWRQPDGRYESEFFDLDPELDTFASISALGYNRLLLFDMQDITYKFYNDSDVLIGQIDNARHFGTYTKVQGATKLKMNVNPMDGRTENPTTFYNLINHEPSEGHHIKNVDIYDNHRGGLANLGKNAIVDNCKFYNTQAYFDAPKFGTLNNPSTTIYQINCEDNVGDNVMFSNNYLADKFHLILLTHNISANIYNNTFVNPGNSNIFIYDLLYGLISENTFDKGNVRGGDGTNKGLVVIEDNDGSPDIILTQGAEWKNNTFTNSKISGKGKFNNNTINGVDIGFFQFTKEVHSNDFIGENEISYVAPDSYIYQNNFTDFSFRVQHGDSSSNFLMLDDVNIDNTNTSSNYTIDRRNKNNVIVVKGGVFKAFKLQHRSTNQDINYEQGSWYFEGATFQDLSSYIVALNVNVDNTIPVKLYFKDCIFTGSGDFLTGSGNYEIVMDNCTVDSNINMNATVTQGTVAIPTIVEPRTMPIPEITQETGYNTIIVVFHIFTLQIRRISTQEIVLDKDVCSTYYHYTDNQTDYEYSIDGGKYWDTINN